MDVKQYLLSIGTDAETAEAISANPQFAAVYEKAAMEAENGKTAYLKAQEIEKSMKQWNDTQVIPYVQKADAEVAKVRAEKAAMATHMKSLKDLGYDIPESYFEGAPASTAAPTAAAPASGKDYEDMILKGQMVQMELLDLAGEAQELTGKRISVNREYESMKKDGRPGENFRQYITRKYDLDTIRSTKEREAEQKKLDDYAATKVAAEKAEWTKLHGSNPDTLIPRASRFDRVAEERKASGSTDDKGRPLWQTEAGRRIATQQRLEKYAGRIQ